MLQLRQEEDEVLPHSPRTHGVSLERPEEAVPFIRKHFNVDCTINLPDSISNSSLTLCQHQSWVTSGPRLLQHLLFLLRALDEPSAANATPFGLVLLLLFVQSGGKKSISNPPLLSTGQQMAQVLCSQLMQMLEKIKENYYPARMSTKAVPEHSGQGGLHTGVC